MPKQRSEKRKRQNRRTLRFDDPELALTVAMAERAGLEWSSWARQALLNAPAARARPVPSVEAESLVCIMGALPRIGGNIHQLLKIARFGGPFDEAEIMPERAEIRDVCRAIMVALGREP